MDEVLAKLPAGANVAVVSMLGSLCPVTLGHVQCYKEARRILLNAGRLGVERPSRLEHFDACVGFITLNPDSGVMLKLRAKKQKSLDMHEREHCVQLATAEIPWLELDGSFDGIERLRKRWPELKFVEFDMNGADDVVKYEKWRWTGRRNRMIAIGRPGYTEQVLKGMKECKIDPNDGNCFISRQLRDISSTAARDASTRADHATLLSLLHPGVADFLLRKDGHGGLPPDVLRHLSEEAEAEAEAEAVRDLPVCPPDHSLPILQDSSLAERRPLRRQAKKGTGAMASRQHDFTDIQTEACKKLLSKRRSVESAGRGAASPAVRQNSSSLAHRAARQSLSSPARRRNSSSSPIQSSK